MVSESQPQLATGHHRLQRTPAFAADQTPAGLVPATSPHCHLDPPLKAAPAPAQPNLRRKAVAASSASSAASSSPQMMLPPQGPRPARQPSPAPSLALPGMCRRAWTGSGRGLQGTGEMAGAEHSFGTHQNWWVWGQEAALGIASPKRGEGFVLEWHCHFGNDRHERVRSCLKAQKG